MKSAFAKLLEKQPVESSHVAFRAGGNQVPIMTRASGQSTAGYQTMGNSVGKTTLGAFRMGDDDGANAVGAIYPGEIFPPIPPEARKYPSRTFENVGNNVFQPEENDNATIALLKRLGDQKFKAVANAPFEDYQAQQRLAREVDEASRNASLSDLGVSREIMRNLAAQRRQQNEDDYLRRMLDSGMTAEGARKEIEDVRNANALQEARKVEDREYQAKTLINRIAMARGVTPMAREPLTQSAAIDTPDRSQAMAQAMGQPGDGFGTAPLDANRIFMNPDFYKRFLRRSMATQEASDEATAFSNLITGGAEEGFTAPMQGSFSMATLKGQERQNQIEIAAESLASRLEAIRQRQNRIKKVLPKPVVGKEILTKLYNAKSKKAGEKILFSPETLDTLNPLQLLVAINDSAARLYPSGEVAFNKLTTEVKKYSWGTPQEPSPTWINDLRSVAVAMNRGDQNIRIPFVSATLPDVKSKDYIDLLKSIKEGAVPKIKIDMDSAVIALRAGEDYEEIPTEAPPAPAPPAPAPAKGYVKALKGARGAILEKRKKAVSDTMSGILDTVEYNAIDGLSKAEAIKELKAAGLPTTGRLPELKARLKSMYE